MKKFWILLYYCIFCKNIVTINVSYRENCGCIIEMRQTMMRVKIDNEEDVDIVMSMHNS